MSNLIQVVCIDNKGNNDKECGVLSKNNIYWGILVNKGENIMNPFYLIYEKNSFVGIFDAIRFITLAEWRDKQIDNILNE